MKTIVLASQKGGAGKTTIAAHLAVAAELAGDSPCVMIDTDPQESLVAWWNCRQSETPAFAPSTLKELSEKLEALDKAGFAVASGAACSSASTEPSATLLAMGVAPEAARGAVRVSVGAANTPAEIDVFLTALSATAHRLRKLTAMAV